MTKASKDMAYIVGLIVFFVLLVVLWPFAMIWAANTLVVGAAIPYNFWSWLAVVVLNIWVAGFGSLAPKK